MSAAHIFKALGDPIRIEIVKRLAQASPATINNLSKDLGISRQGARKQLQVLVSAQVVQLKPAGREILVSLNTASLAEARLFIATMERQWDQRLNALKAFVEGSP
jgi:DNA-binding transcriptional ArsR family regulator